MRRLPCSNVKLVGIVSQRDLYFLETIRGVDIDEDLVGDAMTTDTYAVGPDAPISTVAKHMARHRYGCVVVIERGKVAGIFTATDALRLVGDLATPATSACPRGRRATNRDEGGETSGPHVETAPYAQAVGIVNHGGCVKNTLLLGRIEGRAALDLERKDAGGFADADTHLASPTTATTFDAFTNGHDNRLDVARRHLWCR